MKVRIEYEYDARYDPPYWAKSEGRYRQGHSFEEARDSMNEIMDELKILPDDLGGSYGAKKVIWQDRYWIYKTVRPRLEFTAYEIYKTIEPMKKGHWYVPETCLTPDRSASLQAFVAEAVTGMGLGGTHNVKIDPVTAAEITAFDFLIGQSDRHTSNYMIDLAGQVVLIDHGNAFSQWLVKEFKHFVEPGYIVDWTSATREIEAVITEREPNWTEIDLQIELRSRLKQLASTPVDKAEY